MNLDSLLRFKIMPELRAIYGEKNVTGSSDPRIQGYSITIWAPEGMANNGIAISEVPGGINLVCAQSNVNVQNEYFTEDPSVIVDVIRKYVEDNKYVPTEGRTKMKFEVLEEELGTLTGVNAEKLVNERMDGEESNLTGLGEMISIEREIV